MVGYYALQISSIELVESGRIYSSSLEFQVNVQIKLTLSAGCTPGDTEREGVREKRWRRGERGEMMLNVVCNAVFLSVIGSI